MPNHYDTDVYCLNCRKYIFSYLYNEEDTGKRYCTEKCEHAHKTEQDK